MSAADGFVLVMVWASVMCLLAQYVSGWMRGK